MRNKHKNNGWVQHKTFVCVPRTIHPPLALLIRPLPHANSLLLPAGLHRDAVWDLSVSSFKQLKP